MENMRKYVMHRIYIIGSGSPPPVHLNWRHFTKNKQIQLMYHIASSIPMNHSTVRLLSAKASVLVLGWSGFGISIRWLWFMLCYIFQFVESQWRGEAENRDDKIREVFGFFFFANRWITYFTRVEHLFI